jgi:prepilin-type N-terminal cleavage/methylation domain-containing protein
MNKRAMNTCGMPDQQRGFSLLEMLGALAIASALLIGLVAMMDNSLEDMKGQQAAAYQAQLTTAVRRYIAANHAALAASIPVNGNATAVPVNTLRTGGFLPVGFSDLNIYRQQGCALIRQPAAGQIDALVVTTGGDAIGDKDIAAVAANAGQGSGYIGTRAPGSGTVVGASWSLSTTAYRNVICAGGTALTGAAADAGHLVSRVFQNGDTRADFLYRDDVGVPALNTMNTPILLASNAANRVEDTFCSGAAIATDSAGELLQCVNNKWAYVSKWKAPVATYAALGALPNQSPGDVRMAKDIGRAFMYNGADWIALAEDQNGDLSVTRNVAVGVGAGGGQLTVAGEATIDGHTEIKNSLHTTGHINTDSDINVGGNGYIKGYVMVGDRASMTAMINNRTANKGAQPGDVWAANDLQASAEMHGNWVISDSSITAESMFMNYAKDHVNGGGCNLAYLADGVTHILDRFNQPYTVWPMGTIAAEGSGGLNKNNGMPNGGGSGKLLVCLPDGSSSTGFAWHYVQ